jgi:AAA15 family ATPase/GTPase
MIVDFSVQNFRSIKDLETLAMNAAGIVSRNNQLEATNLITVSPKLSLLKTKAIYGANASGKSTMIQALSRFVNIIINSVKDESILESLNSFRLSDETYFAPTYFQLSFIYNGILYRYGFESILQEIRSEWLFGTPGKKEVPFFIREGSEIKVNENQFQEGAKVVDLYKDSENDIARKNSLFLTVVRSFNQGLAREIIDYISGYIIISGLSDFYMHIKAEQYMGQEHTRKKMAEMLKLADTGIEDIVREEYDTENADGTKEKKYRVITRHKGFDKDGKAVKSVDLYMFTMESEGTKKMFEISPALLQSLEEGRVLVLDEFDARFHPLLSRKIVELYNSSSNKNAQLIFATHDTNLLTSQLLRRDQICFVEKDRQGASHFYSLADFKGVRNDASFEKDYITGKYGAIPFLGDFTSLFEK